jgi:hypothetical protein
MGNSLGYRAQTFSGTHPVFYSLDIGDSSLRIYRNNPETDPSPPFSVEVKNTWKYISTSP